MVEETVTKGLWQEDNIATIKWGMLTVSLKAENIE